MSHAGFHRFNPSDKQQTVFVLVVGAGSYSLHWSKVESVWVSRNLATWRGEHVVAQIEKYEQALRDGDWSYECMKETAERMPEMAKLLEDEESDFYSPTLVRYDARFEVIELPLLIVRPVEA